MADTPHTLTDEQKTHLAHIVTTFEILARSKYTAGAREHGGNLYDLTPIQLIEHAIEENIDQFAYLVTARQNLLNKTNTCWCGRAFTTPAALFSHVIDAHSPSAGS